MPSIFLTLVGLCLVYLLFTTLRARFNPALSSIPGPSLAKWTNLYRFFGILRGDFHTRLIALHKQYGTLVRLGPNVVSISSADYIPTIYDNKGNFTKTEFYPPQSMTWEKKQRKNAFSETDERKQSEIKRMSAPAFTLDALLRMEGQMEDCGRLLVDRLSEISVNSMSCDLGSWLHYYAFDVVGEITFSEKLGFLKKGDDVNNMIAAGHFMMPYFTAVGQIPFIHYCLLGNPLLPYVLPGFEMANGGVVFVYRAMQRRATVSPAGRVEMKPGMTGADMLSRWTAVAASEPEKIGLTQIMVHLATNIFAGADTTAISLCTVFYHLIRSPTAMQKLQREIDTATSSGQLSSPPKDREVRDHCPYLNAVIKEALRIHPAVGTILERHVPAQGLDVDGVHLPAGTIVGVNPWVVHNDPDIYPDPEIFRPERWLTPSHPDSKCGGEDHLRRMEKAFFGFGHGKRICLGRNLSQIEMRKIVALLVSNFKVEFADPKKQEWKTKGWFFVSQDMPAVKIQLR